MSCCGRGGDEQPGRVSFPGGRAVRRDRSLRRRPSAHHFLRLVSVCPSVTSQPLGFLRTEKHSDVVVFSDQSEKTRSWADFDCPLTHRQSSPPPSCGGRGHGTLFPRLRIPELSCHNNCDIFAQKADKMHVAPSLFPNLKKCPFKCVCEGRVSGPPECGIFRTQGAQ